MKEVKQPLVEKFYSLLLKLEEIFSTSLLANTQ